MPKFKKDYRSGLHYAPKNVKMCQLASGASWICGSILVKAAGQDNSTQWYSDGTVQIYPRAKVLSAADVAVSGVMASGANYNILGIATTDAPLNFMQTGNPVEIDNWFQNTDVFENLYIFGYVNDEMIWMPYSGATPNVGDWAIPSSGSDGYVEALSQSTNPDGYIIIGKIIQVSSGSEGPQVWTGSGPTPKCLVDPTYKRGW